jgi:hypothetical protein
MVKSYRSVRSAHGRLTSPDSTMPIAISICDFSRFNSANTSCFSLSEVFKILIMGTFLKSFYIGNGVGAEKVRAGGDHLFSGRGRSTIRPKAFRLSPRQSFARPDAPRPARFGSQRVSKSIGWWGWRLGGYSRQAHRRFWDLKHAQVMSLIPEAFDPRTYPNPGRLSIPPNVSHRRKASSLRVVRCITHLVPDAFRRCSPAPASFG